MTGLISVLWEHKDFSWELNKKDQEGSRMINKVQNGSRMVKMHQEGSSYASCTVRLWWVLCGSGGRFTVPMDYGLWQCLITDWIANWKFCWTLCLERGYQPGGFRQIITNLSNNNLFVGRVLANKNLFCREGSSILVFPLFFKFSHLYQCWLGSCKSFSRKCAGVWGILVPLRPCRACDGLP